MGTPIIDGAALEVRVREIARAIAREEAARPEFVTQRNVEAVVGVPARPYMRDAHDKRFRSVKERRLIRARTEEVVGYYALQLNVTTAPAANDADAEAIEFAKVGARWVSR